MAALVLVPDPDLRRAGQTGSAGQRKNRFFRARAFFVANHQSMIDICALFMALPIPVRFLLRSELGRVPFLGWYTRATGNGFCSSGGTSIEARSCGRSGSRSAGCGTQPVRVSGRYAKPGSPGRKVSRWRIFGGPGSAGAGGADCDRRIGCGDAARQFSHSTGHYPGSVSVIRSGPKTSTGVSASSLPGRLREAIVNLLHSR